MSAPTRDDALRRRALEILGPLGDELAREALERGVVDVEHDVTAWDGSGGHVRGHRVIVTVTAPTLARFTERFSPKDALTAALAAAMAERRGEAVVDVRVVEGDARPTHAGAPYRDPRP